MTILNMAGGGGNNINVPLNGISNLTASSGDGQSVIKRTDVGDLVVNGVTVNEWSCTKLVRKTGSAPASSNDGTPVLTETLENAYSVTGYTNTGLTNGTKYYYGAFSVGTNGLETISNIATVTPSASGWQPDASRTIFYYDFEDSNNRLADTSGNGNNATSATSITYEILGGQYVATTSSSASTITTNGLYGASIGTGDFTVSFWHYPVAPSSSNYPMMFGMSSNTSPYPGPSIFFDPHNKNRLGDKVIFRITGTTQKASTTSASSLYNGWHHIVMTRNSGVITCYIDANSEVSWTDSTTAFPTSGSSGGFLISRSGSSQNFPSGAKGDKFILENVGWSATDVTNYYNQTKSNYGIS